MWARACTGGVRSRGDPSAAVTVKAPVQTAAAFPHEREGFARLIPEPPHQEGVVTDHMGHGGRDEDLGGDLGGGGVSAERSAVVRPRARDRALTTGKNRVDHRALRNLVGT
jgi:hypothetical protein